MKYSFERYREDIYNCARTRCGFCVIECPTYREYELETCTARGRNVILRLLLEELIEPTEEVAELFFQCAVCGYCEIRCAVPLVSIFEAARVDFTQLGLQVEKHQKFAESVVMNHNPYFEPHDQRFTCLGAQHTFEPTAELGFFVGCTSAYREHEIAKRTIDILNAAKIPFTLLGDEHCCGSPLLRTGQVELAKELAHYNFQILKEHKVKRLITACAGCYRTLLLDYPELLGKKIGIEVIHVVQLLNELVTEERLAFHKEPSTTKVTYHDPCHLNRHTNLDFAIPRTILKNIPGIELVEMEWNQEHAHCCGAGGGVKSGFSDLALEIGKKRILEAADTGAKLLITSCPFCNRNLRDAAVSLGSNMEVLDITELVTRQMIH
ncbi:MAG: (Fe-S)-binding protein [Candidatus Heimdallarchaeota archaeon]